MVFKIRVHSYIKHLLIQCNKILQLCALILHMSDETYNLKLTTNDRFLRNFTWQFDLLSKIFAEIC